MLESWFAPLIEWLGVGDFPTLLLLALVILVAIKLFKD